MKKPYFYVKIIFVLVFMMMLKPSYSQEVDTQQQLETDGTRFTENSGNETVSEQIQPITSVTTASEGEAHVSEQHWDCLIPVSPNSIFKTEQPYNVDMSTGRVNVKVPLAVAGTDEVQVPIALNHQTGGIKLRDIASWVGLGWNLSGGGKITRVANRFPDKLDGTFITLSRREAWKWEEFEDNVKDKDSQPDLFFFEIPGKSGMFVLEGDGTKVNAYTIPYMNIKIEYDITEQSFTITDDKGNRYYFNDTEHTKVTSFEVSKRPNLDYISAWYLTSIYDTKGESIDFEYKDLGTYSGGAERNYVYDTFTKNSTIAVGGSSNDSQSFSSFTSTSEVSSLYLTKISWRYGKLQFISSLNRGDLDNQAYRLDEIVLYTNENKAIKSYYFDYGTFNTGYLLYPSINGTLKLEKITVSTPKATTRQFYRKFEYFEDYNLPAVTPHDSQNSGYYELDHWGYYNGKNTNPIGIPRFEIFGVSGSSVQRPGYDDRTPSFLHTRANSLKKIWTSASAYTEFEYELNTARKDYPNGFVAVDTVGGLRIKSIFTKAEELRNVSQKIKYEYNDDDGKTSGVVFAEPGYHHMAASMPQISSLFYIVKDTPVRSMFDLDGSNVRYGKVKEIFNNGSSNTYYFTTYADRPDKGYSRVISLNPHASGNFEYPWCLKNNYDFAPTNTRFWERGLLKEKISADNTGNETYRETYEYSFDAPVIKQIYSVFPFIIGGSKTVGYLVDENPYLACTEYISQPIYVTKKTVSGIDFPKIVSTYIYDDEDHIVKGYDHLLLKKQIDTCGTDVYKTIFRYPSDYSVIPSSAQGNDIAYMKTNNISSLPIEIVRYKNDKVVGGELYIYKTWNLMQNGSITGAMFNLKEIKQLVLKEPKLMSSFRQSAFLPDINGYKFSYDPNYITTKIFEYNQLNKVSTVKERGKPAQSILYGYKNSLPVAQVLNAESKIINSEFRTSALHTSFEDSTGRLDSNAKTGSKVLNGDYFINSSDFVPGIYNVCYWASYNNGEEWELQEHEMEVIENQDRTFTIGGGIMIDELRVYPKGATMKTRTYDDSRNITSETDENMSTTYYEYDAFGRLITVRDNNKDLLNRYTYFIKNN